MSLTTTSARPASFKAATTFEPMNPAPPVTRSIRDPVAVTAAVWGAFLCPRPAGHATLGLAPISARFLADKPKRSFGGRFPGWTGPQKPGYRLPVSQPEMNNKANAAASEA